MKIFLSYGHDSNPSLIEKIKSGRNGFLKAEISYSLATLTGKYVELNYDSLLQIFSVNEHL